MFWYAIRLPASPRPRGTDATFAIEYVNAAVQAHAADAPEKGPAGTRATTPGTFRPLVGHLRLTLAAERMATLASARGSFARANAALRT